MNFEYYGQAGDLTSGMYGDRPWAEVLEHAQSVFHEEASLDDTESGVKRQTELGQESMQILHEVLRRIALVDPIARVVIDSLADYDESLTEDDESEEEVEEEEYAEEEEEGQIEVPPWEDEEDPVPME
jgi:hypothetical protein